MPSITLIAGLPGSGKSTWLDAEVAHSDALALDDFKAKAVNNDSSFGSSRHIPALKQALDSGRSCLISDIDFCRSEARAEAERYIASHFPEAVISWMFFERNVDACRANVVRDEKRRAERRLAAIEQFAGQYSVPVGSILVPVWTG